MNTEQWKSFLTTFVGFVGGILVGKGLLPQVLLDEISNNLAAVIGSISTLVVFGYKLWANRTAGIVNAAAALPQVTSIKVNDPSLASNEVTPAKVTQ